MGLLDNTTQQAYYQGNNYGNYQFTSLEDIINQFIIAYTGENKIILKVKRTDVAFHAQRAMQELSFDTLRCVKSLEVEVANLLITISAIADMSALTIVSSSICNDVTEPSDNPPAP